MDSCLSPAGNARLRADYPYVGRLYISVSPCTSRLPYSARTNEADRPQAVHTDNHRRQSGIGQSLLTSFLSHMVTHDELQDMTGSESSQGPISDVDSWNTHSFLFPIDSLDAVDSVPENGRRAIFGSKKRHDVQKSMHYLQSRLWSIRTTFIQCSSLE